jgi:hypothetical protein
MKKLLTKLLVLKNNCVNLTRQAEATPTRESASRQQDLSGVAARFEKPRHPRRAAKRRCGHGAPARSHARTRRPVRRVIYLSILTDDLAGSLPLRLGHCFAYSS